MKSVFIGSNIDDSLVMAKIAMASRGYAQHEYTITERADGSVEVETRSIPFEKRGKKKRKNA